jgi:hypothetical protein
MFMVASKGHAERAADGSIADRIDVEAKTR